MKYQEAVEKAAKAAHEVNRVYCIALGDESQSKWEDAPTWQTDSAVNGVIAILENPCWSESSSHDNWLQEKEKSGWKWGPVKDPDKKEHPCMVPYEDLPVDQRMKDTIFLAVVKGILGLE
jgi:hypothetical protein